MSLIGLNTGAATFQTSIKANTRVLAYQSLLLLLDITSSTNLIYIIAELIKIYANNNKFDSKGNSNLDSKLIIFYITCYNLRLLKVELLRAFLTMLKGLARDYFYAYNLYTRTYNEAISHLYGLFKGAEF